ncbi:Na(+)/H(+) antiporter [Actinokineospora spheciospongiae]|uniref:Na(+)/H(+) antiporter n=1 Tax=Actinokineospora spheciospongiae TaxID=909613 RepID=W7JCB2_9PSEU|nr:cation:proton antiporter [Actinokineospora spheciospongiae]EWC63669.1 Na(+)/H(+) antiporter [Actinokineospora spheciospongiae]PWW66633.1 transporter (CPA2 family) [Actinokineospora spheciospongiae]
MLDSLRWLGLLLGALVVTLAVAKLGGLLARAVRQPSVVGEIVLGLLTGPFLLWVGGEGVRTALLGEGRLDALNTVAHAGLVLFLVGVGHELKVGAGIPRARSLVWTATGAMLLPAAAGLLMALWVGGQGTDLRGSAPTTSFVLVMLVALTVTAVPVLARILDESGRMDTPAARLALSAAAFIDLVAWAVLAVAITGATGEGDLLSVLGRLGMLVGVVLVITSLGRLLRIGRVRAAAAAHRRVTIVLIGLAALGVALLAKALGINEIILALAVGLALPVDGERGTWTPVAETVARGGRELVPVFFFVTGVGVFAAEVGSIPWAAIGVALVLAVVGKVGGSYLGARLGGSTRGESLELGVLLNTRGLTELVVLQAAFTAGIITPALYLALVVMTLVTTAMTGPLHKRLTREPAEMRSV